MNPIKLHRMVAATLVALTCWTLPGLAEERSSERTRERDDSTSTSAAASTRPGSHSTAALGKTVKADKLIGIDVRNINREDIGDVDNLIVDLSNGRVLMVIVSTGGFLGIGDTLSAVPPQAFDWDAEKNELLLDVKKETLRSYPNFKRTEWPTFNDPVYLTRVYKSYQIEPYFAAPGQAGTVQTTTTVAVPLGQGLQASKLIGMDVQNIQQQKIGDVNNLAIDLANGRVVAVVVSTGGFLGIGDTLSVVPPQAFQLDAGQEVLKLDVNKEALAGYPHLKATEWERLHDPNFVTSIYQAYRVPPYWQHEAAGAGGRVSGSSTVQGANLTDQDLATRIRNALAEETSLSAEARNIKVEIDDGEIEIEGTVASEAEKQRVLDIVRRAAPGSQLDDELKVK